MCTCWFQTRVRRPSGGQAEAKRGRRLVWATYQTKRDQVALVVPSHLAPFALPSIAYFRLETDQCQFSPTETPMPSRRVGGPVTYLVVLMVTPCFLLRDNPRRSHDPKVPEISHLARTDSSSPTKGDTPGSRRRRRRSMLACCSLQSRDPL